ncbi:SDR family NAD(P)-dependent oxidoreductase [Rhodococcus globerulus]|uniref:SDR family oxidoreductase n=1 Tax=Rhodococcus globerulus TaxID=33008 RepID=A0ABU4BYJ4_RHOGO|nr:SDR family oxidoreductase [Rhodococcus globerulus]MDV6269308.1 SDR family oxidoreductase [Rhodococcus globerulus]
MTDLVGRVVIVTGGAVHLGKTYACALADRGASVVVADLSGAALVAESIRGKDGRAIGVDIDLRDPSSLEAMVAKAHDEFGAVHALVNNAGHFRNMFRGPFEDIPESDWDACFDINVKGTWNAIRAVVPGFRKTGGGRIVNVSSSTAFKGLGNVVHYAAAKAAIVGMTRSLARELGPDSICVNAIAPDYVPDDDLHTRSPAARGRAVQGRCLQRDQTADDLVGAVTYLVSEDSAFVTGQTIHVNGGSYFG